MTEDKGLLSAITEGLILLGVKHSAEEFAKQAKQAMMWKPWLSKKVPVRVEAAIRRAYHQGYLNKPINELTDKELLQIRGIGTISLKQIRQVIATAKKSKAVFPAKRRLKVAWGTLYGFLCGLIAGGALVLAIQQLLK